MRFGPQGCGEHSPQLRERVDVPFEKGAQNRFRVATGIEHVAALLQLAAQFGVVVNFAVEDEDGVAVVAEHGLAAVIEIDDLEAHGA